jgi:hypothetical protein
MTPPTQPRAAETAHTPTPWKIKRDAAQAVQFGRFEIINEQGQIIARCESGMFWAYQSGPNAAFIVRACNSHEALVKNHTELRDIYARGGDFYLDYDEAAKRLGRINAALKSATQ